MRVFVLLGVLAISACGVPGARKCKTNSDCEKNMCLDGYATTQMTAGVPVATAEQVAEPEEQREVEPLAAEWAEALRS